MKRDTIIKVHENYVKTNDVIFARDIHDIADDLADEPAGEVGGEKYKCSLERWFYSCKLYNINKGCKNCEHYIKSESKQDKEPIEDYVVYDKEHSEKLEEKEWLKTHMPSSDREQQPGKGAEEMLNECKFDNRNIIQNSKEYRK